MVKYTYVELFEDVDERRLCNQNDRTQDLACDVFSDGNGGVRQKSGVFCRAQGSTAAPQRGCAKF